MATGLSGLMRLAGGATGMVVVATLDARGSGSTTVCATTSVTFGGLSPEQEITQKYLTIHKDPVHSFKGYPKLINSSANQYLKKWKVS